MSTLGKRPWGRTGHNLTAPILNATEVALVCMPYSELGQPSLALGLLRACCDRVGISARVVPAHLWFGEEVGPAIYNLIFESYSTTLVGEWTFSEALFPDFRPEDEAYLRKVVEIFKTDLSANWRYLQKRNLYLDNLGLLREIRRRGPNFIERAADRVLELDPRIVGCTSTFQQHCASLALLRTIKRRRPDVITMIGGANCEGKMGQVTFQEFPFVDFLVSGEADGFFGTLCQRLLYSGLEAVPELEGVWSPAHRNGSQSLHGSDVPKVDDAPIGRLDDMDASPIPNYDDYFAALRETSCLGDHVRPALPFQTARGCWWGEKHHCTFCGISRTAMKFRSMSVENILEQMRALRDKYGINTFQGTEYIFDYRFFATLLPRLKELNSHFRFEAKANLKIDQIKAFIEAGVLEIQPGIESFHDDVLQLLNKGTTGIQNIQLLKWALAEGLSVYWNLLHTVPGDRDEWYGEMADLLPSLTHLQPPSACAQIHYDRFSPYWRNPEKYGLYLQPAFGYEHVYPLPVEVLKDIAYFFETPEQRKHFLNYDPARFPGLARLVGEVHRWQRAFHGEPRPKLLATNLGERTVIEDTRGIAVRSHFEIEGLEHRIYAAAENGIVPSMLMKRLQEQGAPAPGEQEVEDAVQALVDRKILLRLSGRLLSLGLVTPMRPLLCETVSKPFAEVVPIYGMLAADKALDEKRPSIALSCIRLPQDQPLSEWLQ